MEIDLNYTAENLRQLAMQRPDLHPKILRHPHCYPQLKTWILQTRQGIASEQAPLPTDPIIPPGDLGPTRTPLSQRAGHFAHLPTGKPGEHSADAQFSWPLPHREGSQQADQPFGDSSHVETSQMNGTQYGQSSGTMGNGPSGGIGPDMGAGFGPTYHAMGGGLGPGMGKGMGSFSSPHLPGAMPGAMAPGPPPKKSGLTSQQLTIAIIAVCVVLIMVAGFFVVKAFMGGDDDNPATAYSSGVIARNAHPVPAETAVLTSKSKEGIVYSLAVSASEGTTSAYIMETKHGQKKSALTTKLATPLPKVLSDPHGTLCSEVKTLACKPAAKKTKAKKPGDKKPSSKPATVELPKTGSLTWDDKNSLWKGDDATYQSDVIFGEVDGVVIGTQDAPEYAGDEETAAIAVSQITAFETDSGDAVWTQELERPAYIAISDNTITVTEASFSEEGEDALFNDDLSDEEAEKIAQSIIEDAEDTTIYELIPADDDTSKDEPPARSGNYRTPDATHYSIKDIDFANAVFPVFFTGGDDCPLDYWYGEEADFSVPPEKQPVPKMRKMPSADEVDCHWTPMKNGVSTKQGKVFDMTAPLVKLNKSDGNQDPEMPLSADADYNDLWDIGYQDLNGDGFTDALISAASLNAIVYYAAILDPDDPQHPYFAEVYGTQDVGFTAVKGGFAIKQSGCIYWKMEFSDMPPTMTRISPPAGQKCLN
ncbi:MAG: hypothetical protein Q4P66_08865 [Actinomycetaceae bacterium]|nr:hypothetical protein [Actinomycetaceae bacterium]